MPLQATSGAASYDAFGGGAAAVPQYIEDVFSTYLYTGTGAALTITNGIDLSTKGGLVWIKDRVATPPHLLIDTIRGGNKFVSSNTTTAQTTESIISAFNTTGFSLTADTVVGDWNWSGDTFASWTFRKQPKFFDVVTYTGTGGAQEVSHNLGSTPGCIIIKRTNVSEDWGVWHRNNGATNNAVTGLSINNTLAASLPGASQTIATSTVFKPGSIANGAQDVIYNTNGATYVAYLFAHDAGGFGLTGTDNVISCGSFTSDGSGLATINLGYEPQWVLLKKTDSTASWYLFDTMRGMTMGNDRWVFPDISDAEGSGINLINPTATGFTVDVSPFGWSDSSLIYIAIRRGPMKVPTSGTSVFGLSARTGTGANATVTGGQTDDAVLVKNRGSAVASLFSSRLTGTGYVVTSSSAAEVAAGTTILQANPWDVMDGVKVGTTSTITNASSNTFINYLFKRAPSFFDEVCYKGTSANLSVTHNLTVVPEMIIVKDRSANADWRVYNIAGGSLNSLYLNGTLAYDNDSTVWNNTSPTSSIFTVGTNSNVNFSGDNYVAYLFATCAGVSKVGSYTGTATTKQIDCGFTGGARFVLIKRTDDSGAWYVWDTARGIVSGNDSYLLLNSTAAEVTNTDYVDTYSAGFEISSTAPAAINASGGTFIFLAIA